MSLKTLWGALCDCFVTKTGFNSLFDSRLSAQKSFVSNQSMPSSTVISYPYSGNTDQHFTAPNDGYLNITAQQSGSQTYISIWSGLGSAINGLNNLSAYVPCRKGETKRFSVSSISTVEFVSTIGGGLRAFLRKLFGVSEEVCYA